MNDYPIIVELLRVS
jgi:hypothetical protein